MVIIIPISPEDNEALNGCLLEAAGSGCWKGVIPIVLFEVLFGLGLFCLLSKDTNGSWPSWLPFV